MIRSNQETDDTCRSLAPKGKQAAKDGQHNSAFRRHVLFHFTTVPCCGTQPRHRACMSPRRHSPSRFCFPCFSRRPRLSVLAPTCLSDNEGRAEPRRGPETSAAAPRLTRPRSGGCCFGGRAGVRPGCRRLTPANSSRSTRNYSVRLTHGGSPARARRSRREPRPHLTRMTAGRAACQHAPAGDRAVNGVLTRCSGAPCTRGHRWSPGRRARGRPARARAAPGQVGRRAQLPPSTLAPADGLLNGPAGAVLAPRGTGA